VKAGSDALRRSVARLAMIGALGVVGALAGPAVAQPSGQAAAATAQFDQGRALLKQKQYAEACLAFEHSQKLDPQWGTLYNLAGCYVLSGKLASAWATYRELEQRDTNLARRKDAGKRARGLDKRLPRLIVRVPDAPSGLAVTLDGVDITGLVGADSPIDLGAHQLHASAPRHQDFDTTATISTEGKTTTVAIVLAPEPRPAVARGRAAPRSDPASRPGPGKDAAAPARTAAPDDPGDARGSRGSVEAVEPTPASRRRTYGVIVAAAGGALVVTGLVFGRMADGKWSDAKALCGSDLTCDNPGDLAAGNRLVADARTRATLSTVFVIGGAAAIAAGAVVVITAPHGSPASTTALRISPAAGSDGVSLTIAGRF
jgi:hypothetical protein